MNLKEAIIIMKEKVKDQTALGYLNTIPKAIDDDGMKGLCKQMELVSDNLKSWRTKEAREVKAFLIDWIDQKKKSFNV